MGSSSSADPDLRTRVRHTEVVAGLGERALGADDLGSLLDDAATSLADALELDAGEVLELRPGGDAAVLRAAVGWPGDVGRTVALDPDSRLGRALDGGGPVVVDDYGADDRVADDPVVEAADASGGITAVVGDATDPWGLLGVHATTDREFDADEVALVERVATLLSSAVERLAERRRLATELDEVFGRVTDAFYALDEQWRFTYVNDEAATLLGVPAEDLLGERIWEAVPGAAGSQLEDRFREAMAAQEPASFERRSEHLDRWVEIRAYPSGSGLSVYFRDVTERVERERDLELFRTLLDHSTDAVLVVDPETGRYLDANDTACRRLGYSREQLLEMSVPDVEVDLPDRASWEQFMADLRETGSATFDGRHRRADGTAFPVEVNATHVELDEEYVLAIARDVTEQREMEERLREREGRISRLIDNVPGMVYRCRNEPGWPMEFVSDACREVTGYDPDALERGDVSWGEDVMVEADRDRVWEAVQDEATDGETFSVTYPIETADGERRWVRSQGRGVYDDDGALVGVEGIVSDVTERKRLEAELDEVFGRVTDAFFALDEEWNFTFLNEHAHELINPDGRELEGENVWDLFPAATGRKFEDQYRRAMDEQVTVSFEEYYPEPLDAWFEVRAYPSESGISVYFRDVTERKERERALEESERRYRTLVEQFPNGAVALVDEDLRYQTVGGSPLDVADAPAEDIEGQPVWDALPAALADELVPRYEAAFEGEASSFETDLDGAVYQFHVVPVRDDAGEVFAALGMSQDVTERREYERQLEESERRYRTIAEYFPNGTVALFDDDLTFTLMAGQAFADIPVDPNAAEGRTLRDVWDGDVADALEPAFRAALAGDEREVEVEYADREWVVHAVPVTDQSGAVFAGMAMVQDITERKDRERYLEDAKSQLEAATQAGAVGTWEWDVETGEIVAGETFARTFGVDPAVAAAGAPADRFFEAIHEADREWVDAKVQQAIESCGEYEAEYRVRNEDGETRWVVSRGRVECDEDGDPVSFPGAVTDITERKRAELELQRNKDQLESLFEILPVGVVVADADGRMIQTNDTAREIWGGDVFDAASVAEYDQFSMRWADSGEPVAPEETTLARVLDNEERTGPDIYEIDTADGERRMIRAEGMPVRDATGAVTRAVATISDVTERAERERELTKYETIVETVNDGIYVKDEADRFTMVNDAYAELTGYDREELVGEPTSLVVDEETISEAAELQAETATGEADQPTLEATVERADGTEVPAEAVFSSFETGDGERNYVGVVRDVTERREQRRRIEESERRYRTLVEHFPNGAVGLFDEDLRYTVAGGRMLDEVGADPGDIVGLTVRERYPSELADQFEPKFEAALAGETSTFEVQIHDRDWLAYTVPVRDDEGEVFAGMVLVQDVTERKERERQLRERERTLERYKEYVDGILDAIDDVFYVIDADGDLVRWNESLSAVTGYDDDEIADMRPADFFVGEDRERARATVRDGFETGSTTAELDLQTRDGESIPYEFDAATLENPWGDTILAGIGRDVSERVERERQLEQSERRYRTLAENFPNGAVSVYDRDLRFQLAQGSVLDDSLPAREQVEGRTVPEVYPSAIVGDLEPLLRAAVEDGETDSAMFEFGGRTWRVWATPLRDADGEIFAGLSFAQDVTEQVERERRLEELVERLEESNERLEHFAYAASHDLQEPLRMVSSYLQLIERRYAEELDEDGREFIEYAVDGADRMREMIEGLLQYSRVETRGDPFERLDLEAVFADARRDLEVRIEESDAEITVDSLPTVHGDGGQLNQVFQNLLRNAIEYSGDDPPRIHVWSERRDDEWVINVRDEGIGIDQADTERIFQVFQRLHNHDEHPGTGIGLALCRRIVERHGGEIWVDSEPDETTTFSFTLPVRSDIDE